MQNAPLCFIMHLLLKSRLENQKNQKNVDKDVIVPDV